MTTDLLRERLYPLRFAVKFAPRSSRTGRDLHVSALHRWARSGVDSVNGARVRLETLRLNGRLFTSREAMARFLARVSGAADVAGDHDVVRSSAAASKRRRSQLAAERELDAAGI